MSFKSLPAKYKGIKYRSRTEARWAVFFSENKIPFIYEHEGFDLDGVWYLPDFYLTFGKAWFEVKPYDPTPDECEKAMRLAKFTRRLVFIAPGVPSAGVGLHVFSPTGKRKSNWQFAYAHEQGIGYICDCLWKVDLEIKIADVTNPSGMYGSGPEQELNEAGRYQF